jgi:RNA 2',3'-cyclic 3'-phosphodiesterase
MADTLRLFVALELPAVAREALGEFRDRADPEVWRPVRDEALHLTLAFLGHRPEADVSVVGDVLGRLALGVVPLALGAGLLLPPRRARVLCAEVLDLSGALGRLQASVSDGLAAAEVYEPERRPFRAHATVARLRSGARPPRAIEDSPEPVEFAGGPVTLFRSQLGRGGAVYEPLVRLEVPS